MDCHGSFSSAVKVFMIAQPCARGYATMVRKFFYAMARDYRVFQSRYWVRVMENHSNDALLSFVVS